MNPANYPIYQYCLLKVESKIFSSKIDLSVELGEQSVQTTDYVTQKTLEVTGYHNVIDALNYLSTLGWETIHVHYREFSGNTSNSPHYMLKRKVSG